MPFPDRVIETSTQLGFEPSHPETLSIRMIPLSKLLRELVGVWNGLFAPVDHRP